MSNVVMIAKSTYVWLDQLSRKYSRPIVRLDEIPDEELDRLARWGFSALWLIGLWERSSASRKIKRIMGNPEAVASAYSLYDYTIAEDLGGEAAFQNLRDRAQKRGIRLASDMVPNHVGLYSRWVVEHPDWFIQTDHPPFPGYRFSGPDLSEDHRVCLQIEDGYWSHRDASVVFRRIDKATGKTIYIYHGNDGTHLPWNDTAQLNYLRADVREAVIRTILHVARKFPIIRFDAAMTLAKKHYQRLWFPFPGEGGAIPSRSEYSLTQEAFDAAIPEELFWREVVDRGAAEAPGTLLLAEAFWLMEGYFVRTLGMHRVYNSAFMNMLKMEDNANYRTTIRNVLEFSPEVLKRFVNFMNNPDEKTAVEQFGKDDKYFGTAVMMVTLPGLPMFGHGQIEGFTEKYGMEYRRAYWDEIVDEHLVRRHEAEIFPLMHQRYLFSGVEHFAFYDFRTSNGTVDENVFAYSNRCGAERSLVLYNNAYNTTAGWVRDSVAFNVGRQDVTRLVRKTLAEALALRLEDRFYLCFRDHRTGLEYLRQNRRLAEEGLYAELRAYQYQVFLNFREIEDTDGSWGRLESQLQGRGVADIHQAHREMTLAPLLEAFGEVMKWERLEPLVSAEEDQKRTAAARKALEKALTRLMEAAVQMGRPPVPFMRIAKPMLEGLRRIARIQTRAARRLAPLSPEWPFEAGMAVRPSPLEIPAKWMVLKCLKPLFAGDTMDSEDSRWMEQWLAGLVLTRSLAESGRDNQQAYLDSLMVKALLRYADLLSLPKVSERTARMKALFEDSDLNDLLGVNSYQGARYFNKECFDHLLDWLLGITLLEEAPAPKSAKRKPEGKADKASMAAAKMKAAAAKAGYRIDKTLQLHA
jgi:glycosidase